MPVSSVSPQMKGRHAIVIGGGMAGLLSAHVVHQYFEHVSLIERDHYPEEPVFRAGVPQGRHVHVLLVRGQHILEAFFPGFKDKLVVQGAIEGDFTADYGYYFPSGWYPPTPSRLKGYACTRPLLEWQVRQEVMAGGRVSVIEGHEVVHLVASSDGRMVTGVQMRARQRTGLAERELIRLTADLVVDASGRDSQVSHWLELLGYPRPPETIVNPFLGYASRLYLPAPDPSRTWKGLVIQPDPPKHLRSGVIWPVEGGHWLVGLGGTGKDYPPTDEDSFLAFVQSLPDPLFSKALNDAQPQSSVFGYRRTENRWRHFEQLRHFPEGLVVLGDAVCTFNPVYGQGMTVAACGAVLLDESLRQQRHYGLAGWSRRFQRKLARMNQTPWQLAMASDYRVPALEGKKLRGLTPVVYRYVDYLIELLPRSPFVGQTFSEVVHMIKPPLALFHPAIVMRVLLHRYSRR